MQHLRRPPRHCRAQTGFHRETSPDQEGQLCITQLAAVSRLGHRHDSAETAVGAFAVDLVLRAGVGAGVLVRQEGKGHWAALKRAFRLLVDDVDDQSPTDAAYVFSGHCPLTVRGRARPCSCSVWKC